MTSFSQNNKSVFALNVCQFQVKSSFLGIFQMPVTVCPQKGDHFIYLQKLNPNSLQRYRLEREEPGLAPLSFSVSYKDKHIRLLYLCKSVFPVQIFWVSLAQAIFMAPGVGDKIFL